MLSLSPSHLPTQPLVLISIEKKHIVTFRNKQKGISCCNAPLLRNEDFLKQKVKWHVSRNRDNIKAGTFHLMLIGFFVIVLQNVHVPLMVVLLVYSDNKNLSINPRIRVKIMENKNLAWFRCNILISTIFHNPNVQI